MNDPQIRKIFHNTFLHKYHQEPTTLVVDELGLEHGKCRADIAVINGHLIGYEIKSDVDTLQRLTFQINSYNSVFDTSSLVVTERHFNEAVHIIPDWWGVILVKEAKNNNIKFSEIKRPKQNEQVDNYSVVQLLWREEVQEILRDLGVKGSRLREKRANLYRYIVEMIESQNLRNIVREYLKKRQGWRRPWQPLPDDD